MLKVLLINGSPHEKGCTNRALQEVASAIEAEGIATEIFHIGQKAIAGCIACGYCSVKGECVSDGDGLNELLGRLEDYAGVVIGSPVYYAGPNGNLLSFLDRLFYAGSEKLAGKPGAAVVSCRRSGTTASFDRLNKYFTISSMPVVSSSYWNGVHGNCAEEVEEDLEGLHTMRTLGRNMAWMIKCFEAGKAIGIEFPEPEPKPFTNFVR